MIGENRPKIGVGGNFEPIPSGKYTLQVADVNTITDSFKGVESTKFKFTFIILTDTKFTVKETGVEETTRGRRLWQRFSMYLTPRSYLMNFVRILDPSVWDMTPEQKEMYDVDTLIGKQIDALVSKEPNKDGSAIYNNITNFEECGKELEGFEDLPGKPVIENKTSVPAEAPADAPAEEVTEETADGFIASLGQENEASEAEKEAEQLEAQLAKAKEKIANAKAKAKESTK